jgi:8-oxo-dGTP pyrophosphatase MutT (NUDIX family)
MSFAESHLGQIRQKWGSAPILFPGVLVVVLNAKGQVLLGRRPDFNAWSALGGSMEIGESMIDTLLREVEEEASVPVKSYEFFGLMSASKYKVIYTHGDITQGINGLFAVTLEHDDVKRDAEHSAMEWFDVQTPPEDTTPATKAMLKMYQEFRRTGAAQID